MQCKHKNKKYLLIIKENFYQNYLKQFINIINLMVLIRIGKGHLTTIF